MATATANRPVQRIVILGGGFAGVHTARCLERRLKHQPDVELVLVNQENYLVFQPLLAEVVSGNIGLLDTVNPIRRMLKRTRLYVREIDGINLDEQTVTLTPGFRPRPDVLHYDHLVLALGNVTDFRGIPGLPEHALPFKTLADAVCLRNHLLHALEEASIETDPDVRASLLTFVIAGGGFSGVEVAAEMNDFLRRIAGEYRQIDPAAIRVILVHTGDQVLHRELGAELSKYATNVLRKRGVELILGHRLTAASRDAAILDDGRRILTRTLVSTVPSSPNPLIDALQVPKQRGRPLVDRYLSLNGHAHVWALGDCALVPMAGEGEFCPPTAQHAIRQATTVAQNIAAKLKGEPLSEFSFQGLGKMGSLGHRCAVAELFNRFRFSGFVAWLMWRTVYWWKLPGAARKARVGIAWFLDLIMPPDTVELKIHPAGGVAQAHFEAGEIIFRQGDLGDALYIILNGEVDVIIESEDTSHVVAVLTAGDYFGELALLNDHHRSATIQCKTPVDVLTMHRADFAALTTNLPELKKSFQHPDRENASPLPH
ncbi:FAD-dependent oxidoreductase [Roseimaritima ulvae]|uniref:NADH dehydrogenase-like protein n=1 Tax=Roseimaritima ulvae TaxID=980254 RepID=A0A5B9QYQ6_9BACT|nr:FAD-dependent oxidoreductase [Roseimaritima ulvae]QEG43069.1 NADH dehydrogenase-like protein [Roseimaritima ulvae]